MPRRVNDEAKAVIAQAMAIGGTFAKPTKRREPTPHGPARPVNRVKPAPAEMLDTVRAQPCRFIGEPVSHNDARRVCLYDGRGRNWDFAILGAKCCGQSKQNVQRCIACDEHLPAWPFLPTRSSSPASIVESFRQNATLPDAWKTWPHVPRAMQLLADEALATIPDCPTGLSGHGILTCGGGRYDASVYVMARTVRHVGCTLPIEVWHNGDAEPISDATRSIPGVIVRNLDDVPDLRRRGGWCNKTAAMIGCLTHGSRWREFMFMDADAYPTRDPEYCFDHNPTGCVVWADRTYADGHLQRPSYGENIDWSYAPIPITGGHYLFRFPECWRAVWLARHYDQFSDWWYCWRNGIGGFGDQDQMRVAITRTQTPFHLYADRCEHQPGIFSYYGPEGVTGDRLFYHRAGAKFGKMKDFSQPPRKVPGLPMEDEVWGFFEEWKCLIS